ncbi:gamma-interferon-responsive lysosomal thiol protein [Ipomoea triloba]|uniref:gamma-interferon-responsive lysosomal thiol protein n=1 Tax=Ipomoea triloba TaxID=35885 RepID=UPI00125E352A|nr:gamma-interferon-responsive lysosomal thiol protein [Ipomoea triloba]
MAVSHQQTKICFLICLLFFTSLSPISCEKVSLDLYYESLCPYSANFIVNYLAKIFENGIIDIVDLTLFPWGNAKLKGNNTFECQHGSAECLLNTIEACAIDAWPDLNEHFPFIYCVESLVYNENYSKWETCYEKLGKDPKPVSDCYASGRGKELELSYAAQTNALEPPHEYVPWVVVNGQPLYEDYENFVSYICKAYEGRDKVATCRELPADATQDGMIRFINPFRYTKRTTPKLSTMGSVVMSLLNLAKRVAAE